MRAPVPASLISVASVPPGRPCLRHVHDPAVGGVVRLPDPTVSGASAGQWWPHPEPEPAGRRGAAVVVVGSGTGPPRRGREGARTRGRPVRVGLVAPGPDGHGVVRHAAIVARLLRRRGVEVVGDGGAGVDVVHAQFTDALWGPDIAAAAAAFTRWSAAVPVPLVVTLHDVPGADPDPRRDERRRRGYAQVVAAADVVVVSARHEATKVAALGGRGATVIGLPVEPLPDGPRPGWADRPTLGVLGFVYPGKGHADVVRAAARLPGRPRVVAAGSAGAGHGALVGRLQDLAAALEVDLVVTGPLDDAGMGAAARAVTVPVVPGRTVSASGTLATWWAAGRRPLVAGGTYATEQARAFPDALVTYGPGGLPGPAAAALADPARTLLAGPRSWPDVGAAHLDVYASALVVRC